MKRQTIWVLFSALAVGAYMVAFVPDVRRTVAAVVNDSCGSTYEFPPGTPSPNATFNAENPSNWDDGTYWDDVSITGDENCVVDTAYFEAYSDQTTTPTTVVATTSTTTTTTSTSTVVPPTTLLPPTTIVPCVFSGFFAPVDNAPTVNVVNAGAAVPIKFGFCTSGTLAIFAGGSPSSSSHACGSAVSDPIEETVTATTSGLSFANSRYQYNWKTDKVWAGQCRRLQLAFTDGSTRSAEFRFK